MNNQDMNNQNMYGQNMNNQNMYGQNMNNQNMYGQDMYNQNTYAPPVEAAPEKKTWAIWSLVMGMLGIASCCGSTFVPSILAIVFASISKKNNEGGTGMAKAGKILGIIGIILGVLAIIFYIIYMIVAVGAGLASADLGYFFDPGYYLY